MNTTEIPKIIDAELVLNVFKKRFIAFLDKAVSSGAYLSSTPLSNTDIGEELMSRYTLLNSSNATRSEKSRLEGVSFWARLAAWIIDDIGLSQTQLDELSLLLAKKRVDYGCKNITGFGEIGIIVRAMDKVHRLENMAARGGETAVGESVDDALNDIIGYAGVAYLFLTEQWMDETISDVIEPEPEVVPMRFVPVPGLVFLGARGMHWAVNYMDYKTMISRRVDSRGSTIIARDAIPAESGQDIHQVTFCLSHVPTRSYIFIQLLEQHYRANSPMVLWGSTDLMIMAAEEVLGIKVVA